MDIKPIKVKIRDLVEGYSDNGENGVVAYGGKLDVRPPYQREFIYDTTKKDAVITTVENGYPLNVMYWAEREDGTFEIIDGQQRTLSICQFIQGDFSHNFIYFPTINDPELKKKYLDYELDIYVCSGTDEEKLKWFETINIAGEELTPQELRNAVYHGTFIADAKRYFSRVNGAAALLSKDIVTKSVARQELLELALKWICARDGINDIRLYMAEHRNDPNATLLWQYFQNIINWVQNNFYYTRRKKIINNQDWQKWYESKKDEPIDKDALDNKIAALIIDSDVENKRGIIPYLFTGDERHLGLRAFGDDIRMAVYEEQGGICPICGEHFELEEMEADHIIAWSNGGKTVKENCQMLCMMCNRTKSNH